MDPKKTTQISRRSFLKLAGVASASGLLAACAKAASELDSPTALPVGKEELTSPPSTQPVTIRYGRHDAIDGDVQNIKDFMAQYPHITVEQELIADFDSKIPALAAAGTLPDVVRSWESMDLEMGRNGQFIDLQPYVDSQKDFNPQDFYENWWNYPVLAGKRFGIPDVAAPHMTFYNEDLFNARDIELPDPANFTWDDFAQKARALSDPVNKTWGSETIPVGWTYFTLKQVWQNGGDFFSPDYLTCVVDQPAAIEAVQFWADLLLEGNVMPSPSQIADMGGTNVAAELFSAGRLGMQRMGIWITQVCIDAGFKWNIAPEPKKTRMDTIQHGAFNAVSTSSKNKDQAWLWVNHHCSTQGIFNYATLGKFPGARRSTNELTPHPWEADVDFEVNWDLIPQSLEYAHVLPGPAHESEALKVIDDALQKIYAGEAKAADILPGIAKQATAIISAD
jgi:ABC-type glycerol-3-phosphate transport system substrate-binding protein